MQSGAWRPFNKAIQMAEKKREGVSSELVGRKLSSLAKICFIFSSWNILPQGEPQVIYVPAWLVEWRDF